MKRRTTFTFKLLFLAYTAAVLSLCFFNFSFQRNSIPQHVMGIPADKAVHFLMFAPCPILIQAAFSRTKLLMSFILGILFAASTELVQNYLLPYRDGDIFDFFADVVGIMVGLICLLIVRRKYFRQPDDSPTRPHSV